MTKQNKYRYFFTLYCFIFLLVDSLNKGILQTKKIYHDLKKNYNTFCIEIDMAIFEAFCKVISSKINISYSFVTCAIFIFYLFNILTICLISPTTNKAPLFHLFIIFRCPIRRWQTSW